MYHGVWCAAPGYRTDGELRDPRFLLSTAALLAGTRGNAIRRLVRFGPDHGISAVLAESPVTGNGYRRSAAVVEMAVRLSWGGDVVVVVGVWLRDSPGKFAADGTTADLDRVTLREGGDWRVRVRGSGGGGDAVYGGDGVDLYLAPDAGGAAFVAPKGADSQVENRARLGRRRAWNVVGVPSKFGGAGALECVLDGAG